MNDSSDFFNIEPGDMFVRRQPYVSVSVVVKTISKKSCVRSIDTYECGKVIIFDEHYVFSKMDGWEKLS